MLEFSIVSWFCLGCLLVHSCWFDLVSNDTDFVFLICNVLLLFKLRSFVGTVLGIVLVSKKLWFLSSCTRLWVVCSIAVSSSVDWADCNLSCLKVLILLKLPIWTLLVLSMLSFGFKRIESWWACLDLTLLRSLIECVPTLPSKRVEPACKIFLDSVLPLDINRSFLLLVFSISISSWFFLNRFVRSGRLRSGRGCKVVEFVLSPFPVLTLISCWCVIPLGCNWIESEFELTLDFVLSYFNILSFIPLISCVCISSKFLLATLFFASIRFWSRLRIGLSSFRCLFVNGSLWSSCWSLANESPLSLSFDVRTNFPPVCSPFSTLVRVPVCKRAWCGVWKHVTSVDFLCSTWMASWVLSFRGKSWPFVSWRTLTP